MDGSEDSDPKNPPSGRNFVLGVGLDEDGHRRITRGNGFHVEGGTADTHQRLREVVIKVDEKLRRKGSDIPTAEPREVQDLIREQIDRVGD